MKKASLFLLILLALTACNSGGTSSETETGTPDATTETVTEAPAAEKSPYIGDWKVMEVDGQTVQITQVFTFNEDGTMGQSIMGSEVSKGTWKTVDEGIMGIGETGKEDLFTVESVDATSLIFSWNGKRSVLEKQ